MAEECDEVDLAEIYLFLHELPALPGFYEIQKPTDTERQIKGQKPYQDLPSHLVNGFIL